MRIGAIEITPLSDGELHVPPGELLNKGAEQWPPGFLDADDLMPVNFGGFLVRTPDRVVVVDTGIGGGALPAMPIGSFPERLNQAGVNPEDVTDVIFTHLHFDHVGWATDGRTPRFANAAHHCHALDWAYWCGPHPAAETGPGRAEFGALPAPERLAPLQDRIRRHETDTEIVAGVSLRLAPGHSPGHCIVAVESRGERALLLADAAHNPAQLLTDDWSSATDVDPELARATRAALARELLDSGTLATMTHDAGNRFGRLVSAGGGRRWERYAPSIE
jgi:glyoxylase-like metal-dependent hydrolase (beta-lactamase superfamily II)